MKIVYLSTEISLESNHEVIIISHSNYKKAGLHSTISTIKQFNPDLILEREFNDGKSYFDELYEALPDIKKAYWAIDSHLSFDRHVRYMRNFNYCFCAISKFQSKFLQETKKPCFWLPLYMPGYTVGMTINLINKKRDLSFIGNYQKDFFVKRKKYLDYLKDLWGNSLFLTTDYSNMPNLVNQTIVNFNCSLRDDMNFRVFETLGYGAFLVTDDVPDIYKVKGLADRIFIYRTEKEALEMIHDKLSFYHTNIKKAMQEIIENQDWVLKNHTLLNRFDQIAEMIDTGKQVEF